MKRRSFVQKLWTSAAIAANRFRNLATLVGAFSAHGSASLAETSSNVAVVVVSASSFNSAKNGSKPYDLIQSVVDFVNGMIEDGYYIRQELPQKALQAYHADYYLAQVNNGGHSQFIHNAGADAHQTFADALGGLEAMGSPHAEVLRDMIRWVADSPDEAAKQTGFEGGRSEYLDELDAKFYSLSDKSDMIKTSAVWILSWPELLIVDDAEVAKKMGEIYLANPNATERKKSKNLRLLRRKTTDHLQVAVYLALRSHSPPEWLIRFGGGSTENIEGLATMTYFIESNAGMRMVAFKDDNLIVYEYLDPDREKLSEIKKTKGFEAAFDFFQSSEYRKASIGKRMSVVSGSEIANALRVSLNTNAAAVIAALLAKMKQDGEQIGVGSLRVEQMPDGGEVIRWLVKTSEDSFTIVTFSEGGVAYSLSADEFVGAISRPEVDDYVRRYG